MNVDLYKESFDLFCNHIKNPQASILELACGPGNITAYLLSKSPNYRILGTDLSGNMIKLAKINNPSAKFIIKDCRDIHQLKNIFDAVMCGFCLPYLSKEEAAKLISDVYEILNNDGVIYMSTMEGDYTQSGLKTSGNGKYQLYMYYHQAEFLTNVLKENHFKIIDVQRKEYMYNNEPTTDLIIIAKK
jgi:SAM-dependent methyltransferase